MFCNKKSTALYNHEGETLPSTAAVKISLELVHVVSYER